MQSGIQKFLEKQKREEEENAEKQRQKKLELIARRDPKEQRKIEKALKVIKSSKKFFSGDSTLDENTAMTMENEQPDEDDYGYTSTVSDLFHKKLMEKYQKMPEEKKFSSSGKHKAMSKDEIQRTKDRVKNAFASKEDDHSLKQGVQQRTSKVRSDNTSGAGPSAKSIQPLDKRNGEKLKPKLKPAPIVDFQELLKIAAQKQHEEITIEVPTKKEPERLLTSKEKRELEEIEAARRARQKPNRIPKLGSAIPKAGETSKAGEKKQDRNNNSSDSITKKAATPLSKLPPRPQSNSADSQRKPQSSIPSSSSKLRDALQKFDGSPRPSLSKMPAPSQKPPSKSYPPTKSKELPSKVSNVSGNSSQKPSALNGVLRNDKARPSTSSKPPVRDFPPKDLMRSREFPPKDLIRSREFPPRNKRPNQQQTSLKRKCKSIACPTSNFIIFRNALGRRIEDEESDYDSEMDDFIDDGEEETDFSSEIKKIFGYDKSR